MNWPYYVASVVVILGAYYGLHSLSWFKTRHRFVRAIILAFAVFVLLLIVGAVVPLAEPD